MFVQDFAKNAAKLREQQVMTLTITTLPRLSAAQLALAQVLGHCNCNRTPTSRQLMRIVPFRHQHIAATAATVASSSI
jgi:hypothetical protein